MEISFSALKKKINKKIKFFILKFKLGESFDFDFRIFKLYMVMKFFSCTAFSSLYDVYHQLLKHTQFHPLPHFHFQIQ